VGGVEVGPEPDRRLREVARRRHDGGHGGVLREGVVPQQVDEGVVDLFWECIIAILIIR
jgi:hypothetical protein